MTDRFSAGSDKIGELRIVGHGKESGQFIGSDWISSKTIANFNSLFWKLRPLFASEGYITLGGCKVGQSSDLLLKLSDMTGVPVRGFTASQLPLFPGDEGSETRCYITCTRGVRNNLCDWLDRFFVI